MVRIVFTGGGTGGHIFPLVAVLRELKAAFIAVQVEHEFIFMGPKDDFASAIFGAEQIPVSSIVSGKFRRYFSLKNFIDALKIPLGIFQASVRLWSFMPDVVFSKGGYGSLPVVLTSWFFRIPVILHESDSVSGLANRLMSRLSSKVIGSFPNTAGLPEKKTVVFGNPVRRWIFPGGREEALAYFKMGVGRGTILVMGGSQGASRINDFILLILPRLLVKYNVIHQCGEKNFEAVKKEAKALLTKQALDFYSPHPFLQENEMGLALTASEIVIGRSGSGSIFEIAEAGKPAILIPLPESAQDHQIVNAYIYAESGAAIVIEEKNLSPNFFLERIAHILEDKKVYNAMSRQARIFSKPNAAYNIASEILKLLEKA